MGQPVDLYTVIIGSGLLLAPLGLLFALLGARELHRRHAPDQVLRPGALVVVALPPFWDFVTSGLETPSSSAGSACAGGC